MTRNCASQLLCFDPTVCLPTQGGSTHISLTPHKCEGPTVTDLRSCDPLDLCGTRWPDPSGSVRNPPGWPIGDRVGRVAWSIGLQIGREVSQSVALKSGKPTLSLSPSSRKPDVTQTQANPPVGPRGNGEADNGKAQPLPR